MTKMDGHLEGLENLFSSYKDRLEKAKREAAERMKANEGKFANFQASTRRRRLNARQMREELAKKTHTMVRRLMVLNNQEVPKEDGLQMYNTLKDAFNAFDKDGNAELGYPEYVEAWKFLAQPGTESDIKKAFDGVDFDNSGLVEWEEFVFSIMGEESRASC